MIKIKSEKNFVQKITSTLNVEVVKRSHRNIPFNRAMNYLNYWSNTINKILVAYEVKLNNVHRKYPDFLLLFKNKSLRIEIKDRESEQTIAKEINSIDRFKEDEFWYVIEDHHDRDKILSYSTKKDVRIKVIYSQQNVMEKINK